MLCNPLILPLPPSGPIRLLRTRQLPCSGQSLNLFGKWELTDEQAATLLDMPVRSYRRWKAEGPGRVSRDGRARLSNLMGIHKALRIIFSEAIRGYSRIRAANDAFGGASALDVMLGGELTDIMRVRRYLDAERGGW